VAYETALCRHLSHDQSFASAARIARAT
jgi:hypothetical protein